MSLMLKSKGSNEPPMGSLEPINHVFQDAAPRCNSGRCCQYLLPSISPDAWYLKTKLTRCHIVNVPHALCREMPRGEGRVSKRQRLVIWQISPVLALKPEAVTHAVQVGHLQGIAQLGEPYSWVQYPWFLRPARQDDG